MILFSDIEKMRLFPLSLKNLNCVLFLKALKTEKGPMGLPGMEHRGLFCHLFLVRETLASVAFPEFQRADSNSRLIKGGATKKPSEARLKEPEKLI